MWQVTKIANSQLMMQTCPPGKQIAFENTLLERFYWEHKELPLANRKGPEGIDRWSP